MSLLQRLKNEHLGYLSAIIAAILFGSVSTITKPVLEDLNAFSVSSITYLIAGLSLVPFLKFSFTNSNSNNTLDHTNANSNKNRELQNNKNKNYFFYYLQVLVELL
jgi:uncharacterized membrane protein YkgB